MGGGSEGLIHQEWRNSDPGWITNIGTCPAQQVEGLIRPDVNTDPLQNLERCQVNLMALIVGHHVEADHFAFKNIPVDRHSFHLIVLNVGSMLGERRNFTAANTEYALR